MNIELSVLVASTIAVALLHTVTGPDHYLPFIALSKARGWSFAKTIGWTVLCGCGHVLSSVVLALVAAAIGWSLSRATGFNNIRGGIAGWALLMFGVAYAAWGFYKVKSSRHRHFDVYEDGAVYVFEHKHGEAAAPGERHPVTPWVMFIIFLLGPCEPMIPLLYLPAAKTSTGVMLALIAVYTLFTLAAMMGMVAAGYYGLGFLKSGQWDRYLHPLGGFSIFICGLGMVWLNW